jgi:hypothetical protein
MKISLIYLSYAEVLSEPDTGRKARILNELMSPLDVNIPQYSDPNGGRHKKSVPVETQC